MAYQLSVRVCLCREMWNNMGYFKNVIWLPSKVVTFVIWSIAAVLLETTNCFLVVKLVGYHATMVVAEKADGPQD